MSTLPDSILRIGRTLAVLLVVTCRLSFGQTEGIEIVSPLDGMPVFPNQTVVIDIEPLGGASLEGAVFLTTFSGDLVDAPPFFSNLTIPEQTAGFVDVIVYARSSSGDFLSDEIGLLVQPDGVLQELSVQPTQLSFSRIGDRRHLVVRGAYDDAVTRDLTASSAGTTYLSSSTDVVSVGEDGTMQARGQGSATLSVANGGKTAHVVVEVDLLPTPVADAGPPQVVQCVGPDGALVTLDGSNSFDPDLEPLAFQWTLRGGAILGTSATIEAQFSLGVHEAILTVDDNVDGATSDAVVIAVRDTVPPELSGIPAPITVEQAGSDDASVSVPLPVGTDVCDASIDVTSDAPALFPLGETVVTFTARDDSGNVSTATTSVEVIQASIRGDLDFDGDIDRRDLRKLLKRLRSDATGPNDPADLDGDLRITLRDARRLIRQCTRRRCAVR